MKLTTHLEFDLVAIESEDQLSLLLEVTAPPTPNGRERAPSALQVVLDRSGSMGGGRLAAAQGALDRLVGRLDPRDQLGVVCFDDEVSVVVPSGPVADKAEIRRRVRSIG
ncbi:MAG: VWA domain-containing protein, partial [Solirubrobacterales bacterium]|nr:VWA domain-containing protein [Solirubrobacterales bacterium]